MTTTPTGSARVAGPSHRLPALDWMRGLVMVLMALDHASESFNGGRLFTDAFPLYEPGTPLPAAQFFTRWITHLCAPIFVFLAGAALSLSAERRVAAGAAPRSIDRFILTRGLFIAALDPLWMRWAMVGFHGPALLQVLYAIGLSLVCMVPLRRLSDRAMLTLALVLVFGGEALTGLVMMAAGATPPLPAVLTLTGGQLPGLIVAYPLVPWLAPMMLGWVFGRSLRGAPARTEWRLAVYGAAGLAVFAVVRGANSYGNMLLQRDDGSLVQWLHVSKYPPSLSFLGLELGLMALCLAVLFAIARRSSAPAWTKPLGVLGQTALFFYVLHIHLLSLAAWLLGMHKQAGLVETYAAALAVLLALYPLCAWYRRYKQAHPNSWAQYL